VIGDIFRTVLLDPMVNFLVILNNVLFGSFGLAIIAFTIIIRLATFPLMLRQLRSTKALQLLQPRMQEIQKKYSDPKKRQEETMRLYREMGVNPLGCIGPMLIQIPILIALFYAIQYTLPESPEALERLSGHLYSWSYIQHAIPIEHEFLGLDLRTPSLFMLILVVVTSFLQSKTTTITTTDERQRAQQQMMTYMMPAMFGFFALGFPAGVSLYWVVGSIVGVVSNIAVYGLPALKIQPLVDVKPKTPPPSPPGDASPRPGPARELRTANGVNRNKRPNRRRRA
jgi:YidC/Oxa1 family membrane protein insertase